MNQSLLHFTIVVKDYDEAIDFYVNKLGFTLVEDTYQPEQDKRWVVVAPKGEGSCSIVLGQASNNSQTDHIGDQTGGRVAFFLATDDFWRDYELYQSRGIEFLRMPKEESYGIVSVFKDLYGNQWDLIQRLP